MMMTSRDLVNKLSIVQYVMMWQTATTMEPSRVGVATLSSEEQSLSTSSLCVDGAGTALLIKMPDVLAALVD